MMPKPLVPTSSDKLRLAGIAVVLAAGPICGTAHIWGQGAPPDTPIVIGDGSLYMRSKLAWTNNGSMHVHPNANKTVTSVDIAIGGLTQTVSFNSEACTVAVIYGDNFPIRITTGSTGKGLRVNTAFANFHKGADETELLHNDASSHITHVTVTRGGTTVFDSAASGHSVITVHYQ